MIWLCLFSASGFIDVLVFLAASIVCSKIILGFFCIGHWVANIAFTFLSMLVYHLRGTKCGEDGCGVVVLEC